MLCPECVLLTLDLRRGASVYGGAVHGEKRLVVCSHCGKVIPHAAEGECLSAKLLQLEQCGLAAHRAPLLESVPTPLLVASPQVLAEQAE